MKTTSLETAQERRIDMNKPLSNCCHAPMTVGGEGTTHYYVCTKCGDACDVATRTPAERSKTE